MGYRMHQLNFKPTRHRTGHKSSLLDIFFCNFPKRVKNMENFLNTLSEHEGVRCVVHPKTEIKSPNTFLMRNYKDCTFNILQPMVDENVKLQTLFSNLDPVTIAEKLMTGLKEVTDPVIIKKRIQKRERGSPFWSSTLEEERKKLKILDSKARTSGLIEVARVYKTAKNIHTRNIQNLQKKKLKENLSKMTSRWQTLKDLTPSDDAVPSQIKHNGKIITSPREIANEYSQFLEMKTEKIREDTKFTNFKAQKIFKSVVPRVDEDLVFEDVTIGEK